MLYLPSALSKITTRSFMNDCCLLLSRTLPVSLSLKRTSVGGRRFRHNFGHQELMYFLLREPSELSVEERNLLSSANKFPSCWCCSICVRVPTSFCWCRLQPVYTARKSSADLEKSRDFVQTSGFTFGDNVTHFVTAFSVVACCVLLSTCSFSSHPIFCMAQGGQFVHLCALSFVVKTLHLGTVGGCLAWSSPLPRYRCCVDCLYCDLDT